VTQRTNSGTVRIIDIEDNPADVLLLRVALDEQGEPYELYVLDDGERALDYITEHQAGSSADDPCVVVLDLHLPKYDGLAVLRALKSSPHLSHVHVAVLTSSASPREEAEVKALGVQLYRKKPLLLEEFIELGAEILALCKEPQAWRVAI